MEDTHSSVPTVRTKLELELDINPTWIEICTETNDLFVYACLGSWARRVKVDEGWLIFDAESNEEFDRDAAIRALSVGAPLPSGWYLIDQEVAINAWKEGVKLYGLKWYESGKTDAFTYSKLIQLVIFGEDRYG